MLGFLRKRKLRKLRQKSKETLVMHIGDTPERVYPFLESLIEEFRPDVVIHTGDLVDNVKLERRPDLKPTYEAGLRKLARILKGSGARLYIVPGNEDDPELLRRFFGENLIEPGSVVEIGGKTFALGHCWRDVAGKAADFKLYGHNFKVIPKGLNAILGVNFIFLPSGRVVKVDYPVGTDTARGYKLRRGL
ncbi:metallophosphoesterase [Thermococcus sp. AM4]|uniref:metallophosphoesterase family protein n=1 Tax=Thermococcus sp. (strain AM4) TaxID=246969 RepID=UPI00022997DF|nr:metallophosphoesterase [Thermococcus sp. AM4]EEB73072.2 metallophosphoesterase calcineurin superfamily [Thermococcus sp. AM4]